MLAFIHHSLAAYTDLDCMRSTEIDNEKMMLYSRDWGWESNFKDDLHEKENAVESLPMKWMGRHEQSVKKKRGGQKSTKKSMPRTKESATKPNARWKRRKDNLCWAQD